MDDLQRFVDAQIACYSQVVRELRNGRKETHWMWFIFPQLTGLGKSEMSRMYGISGIAQAQQYLVHPVLGARLAECTQLVMQHERSLQAIFGAVDAKKFYSCMSLFAHAASTPPVNTSDKAIFGSAVERYFGGVIDKASSELMNASDVGQASTR